MLTAEWMSASKIVCRVGPAKDDKGEIIVTTKSGGLGTSTVSFKLLRPDRIGESPEENCNQFFEKMEADFPQIFFKIREW